MLVVPIVLLSLLFGVLVGLVLHENKPMLKMCRKLGFSIAPEPNDATVLRVRKSLAPV